MEIFKDILGGIGGIAGTALTAGAGGIFGFLGAGVSAIGKYFQQKQEHKQRKEIMQLEMDAAAQKGSWQGLTASLKESESSDSNWKIVNAIKSLYRPALTSGLVIVTYLLFRDLMAIFKESGDVVLKGVFTPAEAKGIIVYIVYSMVFSTATAITWWFGDRAFAPPGLKNR